MVTQLALKPIDEQVMVITGASSGIGLATARAAARHGARVVLGARSENALQELVQEIEGTGGEAAYAVVDVAQEHDVRRLAEVALDRFGGIDTWFNNAGVSIYGRIDKVDLEDARRLFETNFWGVVHGSRMALEHLRHHGGALINMGSVAAERSLPLQGFYSASKAAVQGFTECLRVEVQEQDLPVSVTLLKPSAIDTPYVQHARNYFADQPKNPPPVYSARVVADAALHCAQHVVREVTIGGGGRMITAFGRLMPKVRDRFQKRVMIPQQHSGNPVWERNGNSLYEPSEDMNESGGYAGHVCKSSLYTQAALHPMATAAVAIGAGLALAAIFSRGTQSDNQIEMEFVDDCD